MDRLLGKVMFLVSTGGRKGPLRDLVSAALAAGVASLQLREKDVPLRVLLEEAQMCAELVRSAGGVFVVNDRVDVAVAVGADGVHLGMEDFPVRWARRALGPAALVGATCRGLADARRAAEEGASYVSAGPVYASPTKPEMRARGVAAVRRLAEAVNLPVCAIGGIDEKGVAAVMAAGADFVAVSSAIAEAGNPREAARRIVAETARAYAER